MLVLSRRLNESIVIGNDIVITVLEIRGDQIRLGIDAPRSVSVHRQEIYAELARANRDAAGAQSDDVQRLPQPPPD
jgi:carbon storage regulator